MAGNDTTRTATSLGMHLLGRNPDQRRIWQDDLEGCMPTAIEEVVRVRRAGGVHAPDRDRADVTLSGHDFETGDKLVMFYGAASRDPAVFDDPERFDVRRDPNPHLGFGGPGPHFCLGAHLARRELDGGLPSAPHPPARHRGGGGDPVPSMPSASRWWAA